MKPVIIVLTIVSLGLALALLVQHRKDDEQIQALRADNRQLTTDRDAARSKLEETEKVAVRLETDLTKRSQELAATSTDLSKVNTDFSKTQADFKLAQAEIQKQSARIQELEGQKDDLTKRAEDLNSDR